MSTEHPVGTVLVAPEPNEDAPGRPQHLGDPDAARLIKIASPHPDDWPWYRLTGLPGEVPNRFADLSEWRVQPLWQLAQVLGHPDGSERP